jgi:hypothetical protein
MFFPFFSGQLSQFIRKQFHHSFSLDVDTPQHVRHTDYKRLKNTDHGKAEN